MDGHLDEAEGETQRAAPAQVLRDPTHPLADSIPDDQQQEVTGTEAPRDAVHETGFVHLGMTRRDHLVERVPSLPGGS